MTILDQVVAGGRSMVQQFIDKEPVNYVEAGMLYGMATAGHYHAAILGVFHNHAQDPQLKALIKAAIDDLSEATVKKCEDLLRAGKASVPTVDFPKHPLENRLDIPSAARLTDREIAMTLANMHGASQLALIAAINQCYQPEIAGELRAQLNTALDWGYQLLQLMLKRGWLPDMAKVKH